MTCHDDNYGAPLCGDSEPYDAITNDPRLVTCDECRDQRDAR